MTGWQFILPILFLSLEIVSFTKFWPAEDYPQNYYDNNPTRGYCALVITPKISKFKKIFKDRLK